MTREPLKIADIRIEVVRRELPDTGLVSDLGRFSGATEQGVLRVLTEEGIEGNCFVGEFRHGGHGVFNPILRVLAPPMMRTRKSVGRDDDGPISVVEETVIG